MEGQTIKWIKGEITKRQIMIDNATQKTKD